MRDGENLNMNTKGDPASKIILQTLMGCFQIIQKSRKREAKKPKSTFPPKAKRYKTGAVEKTPLSTK